MLTPVVTGLIGVGGRIGGVLGAACVEIPRVFPRMLRRPRQADIVIQRDNNSSSIGAAGARRLPTEYIYIYIPFCSMIFFYVPFYPIQFYAVRH